MKQTKEPSAASSTRASAKSPWSFPIVVADIPDTGRRFDFAADERTREAVAKLAGVVAVRRLEANFELTRQGRDGLRATGRVAATVVQNCVVTLDPVESEVDEAIDLSFIAAAGSPTDKPKTAANQAIEAEDPPEPIQNGEIDLGAIAAEFLLLGIDPYPRKQGVAFDVPVENDPSAHPFAALAALKKGGSPKDR